MKKCGVIIYNNMSERYLCVKGRKSGKWGFPKGHMEYGESEKETALRELKEETGINLHHDMLKERIRFKNNIYFFIDTSIHYATNIHDHREIEKLEWFTFTEMDNMPKDHINFGLSQFLQFGPPPRKVHANRNNIELPFHLPMSVDMIHSSVS